VRDGDETVVGGKSVTLLDKRVRSLRDESTFGNRELFLDDALVLLQRAVLNASLRSMRTFEDLSRTRPGQKVLSVMEVCRGTRLGVPAIVGQSVQRDSENTSLVPRRSPQTSPVSGAFLCPLCLCVSKTSVRIPHWQA
jgi:hypothetical protein